MKLETKVSAQEIALFLGRPLAEPSTTIDIKGISEINTCEEGDIIYVDTEKYYGLALNSKAAAIIAPPDFPEANGKAVIISEKPFFDFVKLVNKFFPEDDEVFEFVVINGAYIAKKKVQIEENVKIYPGVVIYPNTKIGKNVKIHSGSVIGGPPFYYKSINGNRYPMPVRGGVIIEDNVEIGASVTIDKGVLGYTTIGEDTKIDNLVHIAHDVKIGKRCLIAAQTGIAGNTIIEDDVIIWGQVGITSNVRIGKGAVIYAQSGVYCSLPGNEEYLGTPAEPAKTKWRQYAIIKRLPSSPQIINLTNQPTLKKTKDPKD